VGIASVMSESLSPRHGMLRMEEKPPIGRVAVDILNKQLWTDDKGWSSSLGFG